MSAQPTKSVLHSVAIQNHIKRGYVLHMDPDFLLLTYGDITVGEHPKGFVGPRYALCIGVKDDVTFWVMLTSKSRDSNIHEGKIQIPAGIRVGPWAENATPTYLFQDQVWVMTREMAAAAHLQTNGIRKTFRHNSIVERDMTEWPELPVVYPKTFTPIDRMKKILPPPSLVHELVAQSSPTAEPELEGIPTPLEVQEALMAHGLANESPVEVSEAAIDREAHVALATKLLSNPRLTDAEVVRLVDHLQTSVIDTLLGA